MPFRSPLHVPFAKKRDANGDGIGDLPGLCEKLDYCAKLGIDSLWQSSVFRISLSRLLKIWGSAKSDFCLRIFLSSAGRTVNPVHLVMQAWQKRSSLSKTRLWPAYFEFHLRYLYANLVTSSTRMEYFTGHNDATSSIASCETLNLQNGETMLRQPIRAVGSPGSDLSGRVLLNRYEMIKEIGSGGMGQVFEAVDWRRSDLPEANRRVAVKVLHKDITDRPKLLANIRREFYCAQTLSHPNIVKVYEMDSDGDLAFFTMELLEGEMLSAVIDRSRPGSVPRSYAWFVISCVAAAVAHAHSRRVVHGDLKPQNVMITSAGEVRILDFGASGVATRAHGDDEHALRRDRIPPVTPAYTCCELLDGQQTDVRDDLFSLACLSYELLSGEHPFQRRAATEARELGLVPERPTGLTHRQWRAIQQGLAWQRDRRPLSAGKWLKELGVDEGSRPMSLRGAEGAAPPRMRRPQLLGAAAVCAVIASISALLVFGLGDVDKVTSVATATPSNPTDYSLAPLNPWHIESAAKPVLHDEPSTSNPPFAVPTVRTQAATLSTENFRVLPGAGFAEVTVARSSTSVPTGFTWWTEGSTAKPGSDFVPQAQTTQAFSKGKRVTKLFVRILPNDTRTYTAKFYINIAKPYGAKPAHRLARAVVSIPPRSLIASN